MKPELNLMEGSLHLVLRLAVLGILNLQHPPCFGQDSAFTYQGRLMTNGAPFSGSAEFQFTLWDSAANGTAMATNNPSSVIATVNDGLFTVTLDFGVNPFDSQPRFLQADVRTSIGPFMTLTPRQQLTSTPYAIRALYLTTNGLAGTYGNTVTFNNVANSFSGSFSGAFTGAASGNGSGLTNVNAVTLGGLAASSLWRTNGNAGANPTNGAFLGTTDNLPLEFRANGHRVLRLEPDFSGFFPNVIAGSDDNSISSGLTSSVIGGGEENNIRLSAGQSSELGSVIAGGADNLIGGTPGSGSVLLSGGLNVIGGGFANNIRANANFSVIGGGENNIVPTNSQFAIIPGGDSNSATNHAFAAGHRAKAHHDGAFVWADSTDTDFASTGANQFLVRASGGVGINTASPVGTLQVNGPIVIQGPALAPTGTSSSNLLNLMVGGGSSSVATNGSRNGISFYEAASSKAMSLGYDGSGSSSQNALRIYNSSDAPLFTFEASGQLGIGTNSPQQALHVVGNILATGTVTGSSDRNAKENFRSVDPGEVLNKVASLLISRWNYKADDAVTHLGPMAQDFYSNFNIGTDDKHIAPIDEGGVAFAAIQGLNEKVDDRSQKTEDRIQKLEAENVTLKRELSELKELILLRATGIAGANESKQTPTQP